MSKLYYFKEKDCPFCDGGQGSDDRQNMIRKCDHSFTLTELSCLLVAVDDMKKEIKHNINISKKMRKIIEVSK